MYEALEKRGNCAAQYENKSSFSVNTNDQIAGLRGAMFFRNFGLDQALSKLSRELFSHVRKETWRIKRRLYERRVHRPSLYNEIRHFINMMKDEVSRESKNDGATRRGGLFSEILLRDHIPWAKIN